MQRLPGLKTAKAYSLQPRLSATFKCSVCCSNRTLNLDPHRWEPAYTSPELSLSQWEEIWRRGSGSNRRIKVLQTSPLPLGYRASLGLSCFCPAELWEKCTADRTDFGAGDRGRTGDIFLGKEALYH